jgi:predicted nucleic acid-binding protein
VTAVIVDTTFLIDLHRDMVRRQPGPATAILPSISDQAISISVISMGEFLEGVSVDNFPYGVSFIERFELIPVDRSVGIQYAQISRILRAQGQRIGDNDLWIAATALSHGRCLLTRNRQDFERIKNLEVLSY